MQETPVQSLSQEDPLEGEMATHAVFLPGESQGQRSLVGCRLWGCTESDTTDVTQQQQQRAPHALDIQFFWVLFVFFFKLENICFTMLRYFLLCNQVNQLYVYVYPFFLGFPFHLGHHRALSSIPCALQ